MGNPSDPLAWLRSQPRATLQVGDVLRLPSRYYPGFSNKEGRPCLVAGLEHGPDGRAARAHIVAGSTDPANGPRIICVAAGDSGLKRTTYFKFVWSRAYQVTELLRHGQPVGRLQTARLSEIETAVRASNLANLKRVVGS